jgi:hypothetical protein
MRVLADKRKKLVPPLLLERSRVENFQEFRKSLN